MRLYIMITSKMRTLLFALFHAHSFKRLGAGSLLVSPFRVDGADGIELGERTVFQKGVWLYCCGLSNQDAASIAIGEGCVFGYNNHITAVKEVSIGDYVLTANNVYISDNLHEYEDIDVPIIRQPVKFKSSVSVGDGSWIGENVCIIGAKVGKNCVIGANSVVTRDIPDYAVAVGSPAVVIKQYDFEQKIWVKVSKEEAC